MNIAEAIVRLNQQLPLAARQQALPTALRSLHRSLLYSFVRQGRPLNRHQIQEQFPRLSSGQAVADLAAQDLVVLKTEGNEAVGCYPMTLEKTPHAIRLDNYAFYAMCALDALSIAPLFGCRVQIDSRCALSDEPVRIVMQDTQLIEVSPSAELRVGIRWQSPGGVAAHSMCREMVFVRDVEHAHRWQQASDLDSSLFSLPDAITFGYGFFRPLLA